MEPVAWEARAERTRRARKPRAPRAAQPLAQRGSSCSTAPIGLRIYRQPRTLMQVARARNSRHPALQRYKDQGLRSGIPGFAIFDPSSLGSGK